jgi:murein DD-endopeptidase MepM/ murein hydrolase activator NlpD
MALACTLATVVGVHPVSADSVSQKRDQLRRNQAQLSVQIDLISASDTTVAKEAQRLARSVVAEQAVMAGARSALLAAESRVADAQARLDQITGLSAFARAALVARAVDLYEHPFAKETLALHGVSSIGQYAEREALFAAIQGRTSDVLDSYRQQRLDELQASHDLLAARAAARQRQADVQAEETVLTKAGAAVAATDANLRRRVANLRAEARAFAAEDAKLQAQLAATSASFAPQIDQIVIVSGRGGLIWPLHGPVTREFGNQRGGFHPGIDIAAPYGTPIHAAAAGLVIYAGWEGGYGNYTCINHGGGMSTCYAHQSAINVSVGQTVARGQVIGAEGSTGNSTGPHLHFEVRISNAVQNPRRFVGGSP